MLRYYQDIGLFVRLLVILGLISLASCTNAPPPADPSASADYTQAIEELAKINRDADAAFANGKSDDAAKLIEKGEALEAKLVSVEHPTEPALQAASDLDDLYGRMLLSNRHYAWARMFFQKNLARWKHWNPPDDESARRLKRAQDQIAECDRHM